MKNCRQFWWIQWKSSQAVRTANPTHLDAFVRCSIVIGMQSFARDNLDFKSIHKWSAHIWLKPNPPKNQLGSSRLLKFFKSIINCKLGHYQQLWLQCRALQVTIWTSNLSINDPHTSGLNQTPLKINLTHLDFEKFFKSIIKCKLGHYQKLSALHITVWTSNP